MAPITLQKIPLMIIFYAWSKVVNTRPLWFSKKRNISVSTNTSLLFQDYHHIYKTKNFNFLLTFSNIDS